MIVQVDHNQFDIFSSAQIVKRDPGCQESKAFMII